MEIIIYKMLKMNNVPFGNFHFLFFILIGDLMKKYFLSLQFSNSQSQKKTSQVNNQQEFENG